MNRKEFLKAGHFPTLLSAFLYFDVSFMIWVLTGALGISLAEEFNLSAAEKGFMVSIPLFGGTLLRIPMGIMADMYGSRKIAIWGMFLTVVPLIAGWLFVDSIQEMYLVGLLFGFAGASFAVALPLASKWYPQKYQGLVMGIAGAGNSGTVISAFFAPRLAKIFGWHSVFGFALIPLLFVMILFILTAKDSPHFVAQKSFSLKQYFGPLRSRDALLFSFFYSITFGGFVGFASFLPIFFHDQFGVEKVIAGNWTAICVLAGSFVRPIGGYLADKFGGVKVLTGVFMLIGFLSVSLSTAPPIWLTLVLFGALMLNFGIGNGSVFQLVPLRFRKEVGVVTGFVGAFGGLGGFLLPNTLGFLKATSGSFTLGLFVFGFVSIFSAITLSTINQSIWKKEEWSAEMA